MVELARARVLAIRGTILAGCGHSSRMEVARVRPASVARSLSEHPRGVAFICAAQSPTAGLCPDMALVGVVVDTLQSRARHHSGEYLSPTAKARHTTAIAPRRDQHHGRAAKHLLNHCKRIQSQRNI